MWFLCRALTNFRASVNQRWPNRSKASDGTVGDLAHQAGNSSHNPDSTGSVDAWDMTAAGVDVWECIREFERHESSAYWIYNDQICFKSEGWKPRSYAYAGPNRNRHKSHVHFDARRGVRTSAKPWFASTGGFLMALSDAKQNELYDILKGLDWLLRRRGDGTKDIHSYIEGVRQEVVNVSGQVTTLQNTLEGAGTDLEATAAALRVVLGEDNAKKLAELLANL